jgi:hypothetical protein
MYEIIALEYDAEADELDLLVNASAPRAAEAIPLDAGVYARRDFETGDIVGAFIRGYAQFSHNVSENKPIEMQNARSLGLEEFMSAILAWQRDVGTLSQELASHVGKWPPPNQLLQVWAKTPV